MALEKSLIPIVLNGGLDTKTDDKLVIQGKLVEMVNCHMQKGGALAKRNGFAGIGANGDTFTNIDHLTTTSSGELIAVGTTVQHGDCLCSYNPLTDSWVYRSRFNFLSSTTEVISSSTGSAWYTDASYNAASGLILAVWNIGSIGYYSVYNPVNGQKVLIPVQVSTGAKMLPVANSNGGHVIYSSSGFLYVQPIVNQVQYGGPTQITGVNVNNYKFEACGMDNGGVVIIAMNNIGTQVLAFVLSATGVLITSFALVNPLIPNESDYTVCKGPIFNGSPTFFFTFAETVTGVVRPYISQYTTAGSLVWAQTDVVVKNEPAKPIIASVYEAATDTIHTFLSSYADAHTNLCATFKITTVVGSGSSNYVSLKNNNTLLSLPWVYNNHVYAIFCYYSIFSAEMAVYILDEVGNVAALLPNVATQPGTNYLSLGKLRGGEYAGIGIKTRITSINSYGTIFQLSPGIIHSEKQTITSFEAGPTIFSGGIATSYDSEKVSELSFVVAPDRPTLGASAGTTLDVGTYMVKVVFESFDAFGNRRESQPSVTASITIAVQAYSLIVNTVPVPASMLNTEISIVVYRTTANGSIFYRDRSISNQSQQLGVAVNTILPDSELINQQTLYTTGYVFPNQNPGKVSSMLVSKNRCFMAGLQDESDLWYSKYIRPGSAISMTGSFALTTSAGGGGITALGEIDDKVIVFKRAAIYVVAGEGPNDAGQGSALSNPQFITSDVGCTDPRSVVRTPQGLMFKSAKGIYLLDRNLTTQYLGAPVERYNALTVTGTYLDDSKSQVRFTTTAETLVYDYYWNQWSVFDHMAATACCAYQNKMVYATATKVYQEYAGFLDKGVTPVVMTIKTSWIAVSGIAGFERLYGVQILGKFISSHTLNVAFAFDYRNVIDETMQWTPPTTDDDGVYRAEFRQAQQKCTAVQLTISDIPPTGTADMEINTVTLYAGGKKGFAKLKNSRYGQTV